MTTTLRAVGYCRVSSEEQAREGVSLDAQAERIRAYCLAHGWTLVGTITDAGKSGKNLRRPGVLEVLSLVGTNGKPPAVDVVVVAKLDRLTRSTKDALDLCERLQKRGVALVSLSESIDTTTAAGKMFYTMLAAFAEFFRGVIVENTREGLAEVRRQGRKTGGPPPFGYRVGTGAVLVPVGTEQAALQECERLRLSGMGPRRIAAALNARGYRRRDGGAWGPTHVARIAKRKQGGGNYAND